MVLDGVYFDLDNTLYPAEQYMIGAFEDVSDYLSANHSVDPTDVKNSLIENWRTESSMYSHLFDDIIDEYDIVTDVDNLVEVFNDHDPALSLYDGCRDLLSTLNSEYRLGLITDGTAGRQRRKISALYIGEYFDVTILTDELGAAKPSEKPYLTALDHLSVQPSRSCYIGDNPFVDFDGAKAVGMSTIRVNFGEFEDVPSGDSVDISVNSMTQLENAIHNIDETTGDGD